MNNMLKQVAAKFRKSVKLVGIDMDRYNNRLSLDAILQLCATTMPSETSIYHFCLIPPICNELICVLFVLVPSGGWLFEYYMCCNSGYSAHRRWQTILRQHCGDGIECMPQHFQDELIKDNGVAFMGWLLFNIGRMGTNGRRQLFYITFLNHYFGLSRQGINTLAQYGFGVTLDMFDVMYKNTELRPVDNIRYSYKYI